MKKAVKQIRTTAVVLVALIIAVAIGVVVGIMSIDANKYRPQIIDALSKQTGRVIKLNGPIKLGLTWNGAILHIQDAAIGNPNWASRADMAGIGSIDLGVAFLPLLTHELSITEFKIANADILLESSPDGSNNWVMATTPSATMAAAQPAAASPGQPVSIHVDQISIKDSQISLRDKTGKVAVFKAQSLTLAVEHGGFILNFLGEYNATPITLDLKTGTSDFMASGPWPFVADLAYGDYHLTAQGKADMSAKTASVSSYDLVAGNSAVNGAININWSGARPAIKGTIISEKLNPADFNPPADTGNSAAQTSGQQYVFSNMPLQLDGLKAVDASLAINIGQLITGATSLTDVTGTIYLVGGRLDIQQVKGMIGKSPIGGEVTLNAATSPAQLNVIFAAPSVDLSDLLHLGGIEAFLSGKAKADLSIAASGNSMHAMASAATGQMTVIAGVGDVSSGAASDISSSLMKILLPTGGSESMNCMAARFVITNGIVRDNGILVDTPVTTVAGHGGFNLGAETIDLTLRARSKLVNIASVLPPLHVDGTFKHPGFDFDPGAVVQNVVGILTSGSLNGGVPTLESAPGQNACVYTLDHPQAEEASEAPLTSSSGLVGNVINAAPAQLKSMGGQLMKGLFGQ
jgi:uncharacterized protein involved in outer membrane biogenesis